jgi:hypothetical protein
VKWLLGLLNLVAAIFKALKAVDISRAILTRVEKAIDNIILKVSDGAKKLFGKEEGKKHLEIIRRKRITANLPAHQLEESVIGNTASFMPMACITR